MLGAFGRRLFEGLDEVAPFLAGIPLRTGFAGEARFGLINDLRWGERALPRMVDRCAMLALPKGHDLPPAWPQRARVAGWPRVHLESSFPGSGQEGASVIARYTRPEMGRIAALLADRIYVTSDNPRTEDPKAIADAVDTTAAQRQSVAELLQEGRGRLAEVAPDRQSALTRQFSNLVPCK